MCDVYGLGHQQSRMETVVLNREPNIQRNSRSNSMWTLSRISLSFQVCLHTDLKLKLVWGVRTGSTMSESHAHTPCLNSSSLETGKQRHPLQACRCSSFMCGNLSVKSFHRIPPSYISADLNAETSSSQTSCWICLCLILHSAFQLDEIYMKLASLPSKYSESVGLYANLNPTWGNLEKA